MALPQRDKMIDDIHGLEGLMTYKDWDELEWLNGRLHRLLERVYGVKP